MTGVLAVLAAQSVRVSLSEYEISGAGTVTVISTGPITATVIGGTPSSYEWVRTGGWPFTDANSPSSATTTFTGSVFAPETEQTSVFVCRVVVNGVAYDSLPLTVNLIREY